MTIRALVFFLGGACTLLAGVVTRVAASEPVRWGSARGEAAHMNIAQLVPITAEFSEIRYLSGDDPRWAASDWDDSAWAVLPDRRLPSHTGVFWIRFKVRDTQPSASGLFVKATMAYELFWDGRVIGRSGTPGNSVAAERPGALDNIFTLSDDLRTPGVHQIAMRVSNHRNGFPDATMPFLVLVLEPAQYLKQADRGNLQSALVLGAGLVLGFAGLLAWLLVDRRASLLLFCGLCFGAAFMQALFVARFVFAYSYDWHREVWVAQVFFAHVFSGCLACLMVVHFRLPRWVWWVLLPLPAVGFVLWWTQGITRVGLPFLLCLALVGAIWAVVLRRRGALIVAGGVAVTVLIWILNPREFLTTGFIQYILPTLVGLTVAIALTVRDEKRRGEQARLAAARLEIELLRKNLQPHFLLNTLTAVSEVIEQDPTAAVKLIDDLASEFRSLAAMSGERLVPLQRELELCRAHLQVLTRRTGRTLTLRTNGVSLEALVPPAVFLTLIENGLLHQLAETGATFQLDQSEGNAGEINYTFLSPGQPRPAQEAHRGTGTGLRYVRARLEESFPGQWTLEQGLVTAGWQTIIRWRPTSAADFA